MSNTDVPSKSFSSVPLGPDLPREVRQTRLREAMQTERLLENPAPASALRWIDTFLDAYGERLQTVADALPLVTALRDEAVMLPALQLERLRNRQVLFFLDTISQYVDDQAELRGLAVERDVVEIAKEFGIGHDDALWAVRMALTAQPDGPPLNLLFVLLGHERIMMRVGAIASHLLHGRGLRPLERGPGGVPFETIGSRKPE